VWWEQSRVTKTIAGSYLLTNLIERIEKMPKFVQLHFTPKATAKIQKTVPAFTGAQTFKEALDVSIMPEGVSVICAANEADQGKYEGDEVEYFYPLHQIARVKAANLV
jgi:hypothetical protein